MADYGFRNDGKTKKGEGWLGPLSLPSGKGVVTEYSIGVGIDGREVEIPSIVPTLTKDEVQKTLEAAQVGKEPPITVVNKAIEHAKKRMEQGLSPFKEEK